MTWAVIALDVGTSGCKCVVVDETGRLRWTMSLGYPTRRGHDGEVSQDPADWLRVVRRLLREAREALGDLRPLGIGITGPAHYAVLVDSAGSPLNRVLLASDRRPVAIADELRERLGERYLASTRVHLNAGWTLAQLGWLRTQLPDRWDQVAHVLVVKDYVRYALAGVAATDPSDAAGTGMFDQITGDWSDEWLEAGGVTRHQVPRIAPSASVGGSLTSDWARATGLPAGLPVAVGATDTAAELVAINATEDGDAIVKIASTGTVVVALDRPILDRRLLTYPHAVPDRWYVLAATNTAATAYAWLRETVFGSAPQPPAAVYREMDRLASKVPPGADGLLFLPYLEGERTPWFDWRLRATFTGLTSTHRREHLCRAVLEGVALSLRLCTDVVESTGVHVGRPVLAGGGVASRLWRDILVSALDRPCVVVEPQGPALGAARLALAAVGARPLGSRPAGQSRRAAAPRPEWRDTYARLARLATSSTVALQPTSHALDAIARDARALSDDVK